MAAILEIRNLTKRFGMVLAVDNLVLEIAEGETVGIIGTNGSGKTTFLNLVTGYILPTVGTIRFEGVDITGLSPKQVTTRGIARSFQNPQLFTGLTAMENTLIAIAGRAGQAWDGWQPLKRRVWREEAADILDRLGLGDVAEQTVSSLSEGGRKLLDVALSLVLRPSLLLMDEPTSGVSVKDKFDVMDRVLRALDETRVTTVFIEHDMEIIERYAQRALAFDGGRVIADGTVDAILADPVVRESVLGAA